MFDFVTINWSKVNSPSEFLFVIGIFGLIVAAVYFWVNRKKTEVVSQLDDSTINSYKNALEATRLEFQQKLDRCDRQHRESQTQLAQLAKDGAVQQGQIDVLKDIPLAQLAGGIVDLVRTQKLILARLDASAVQLVEDTKSAARAAEQVKADLEAV